MECTWQQRVLAALLLALGGITEAGAQAFSSGSTGAHGPFPPTSPPSGTTGISLNLNTGTVTYTPSNTVASLLNVPVGGFQDGVLHVTTFTLGTGITLTVVKNAANTPLTVLATQDLTIAGTLEVSGATGGTGGTGTATFPTGGLGGPEGFAGGSGSTGTVSLLGGTGLGPGGGASAGTAGGCGGAAGGHNGTGGGPGFGASCPGGPGGASYGTATLLPLLGGSGGSGGTARFGLSAGGGGGGGGALLLASSTRITLTGTIRANGGNGGNGAMFDAAGGGGGGSGGAIRLVAPVLIGTGGTLQVAGGNGGITGVGSGQGGNGASGRLRLEASSFSLTATMTVTPSQGPLGAVTLASPPSLRFTSAAGVPAPAAPQGSYATPDLTLPTGFTNPATITLAGSQIPVGTVITVRSVPLQGSATSTTGSLTGTTEASTTSMTLNLPTNQPTVLTAEATFALTASMGTGPLYAEGPVPSLVEGEEVTHVRVAATFGGPSTVTYLTASGKEVPATALASQAP